MAIEIYELVVEGQLSAEQRENVLHFQGTGTDPNDTQAGGESLIRAWRASFQGPWLAALPNSYSLELLSARRTVKPSTVVKEQNQFGSVPGTHAAGNAVSQQVSPSVFLIPPTGTKSGGKIFMPAAPAGIVANNQFTAAYITIMNTFISALQTGATDSSITWIGFIYSRKLRSGVPIMSHSLSSVVGFQNRRRTPVAD